MDRINLQVEDGVGDKMTELAGGERRRGAWLSDLVNAMHAQQQMPVQPAELETLKLAFAGMVARLSMAEARAARTEAQLAAHLATSHPTDRT
jgi:hypothetical protein